MNEVDNILRGPIPKPLAKLEAQGPGRAFWREVLGSYRLRVDELRLLEDACAELDLIDRMRKQIAEAGDLVVTGARGAVVAHPLIDEVRKHEVLLAQLVKALGIADADADSMSASNSGRSLARRRWGPR